MSKRTQEHFFELTGPYGLRITATGLGLFVAALLVITYAVSHILK